MDNHVQRIEDGWDVTKQKAEDRLAFLQKTKDAWIGYAEGLEAIALEFAKADKETKNVKKRFNLQSAIEDLEKRQSIFGDNKQAIEELYKSIQDNYDVMTMSLPDDKKEFVRKEVKAVTDKLDCVGKFEEKVKKIENFVTDLKSFDGTLKNVDEWMTAANNQLKDIKETRDTLTPEDRVTYTMELQEDIAERVKVIQEAIGKETTLLPQGEKVPTDAQDFKDELKRIEKYVLDLQEKVKKECQAYSEDIKHWAEYKTGIREFKPWLENIEAKAKEGLQKPSTFEEANAMFASVKEFEEGCARNIKILNTANGAAQRMTTHLDADDEVAELKGRYDNVKGVADEWVKKVDTLVKEWQLLDSTVNDLNSWVGQEGKESERAFSLEKMESTLGELKNIFKEKEKLVEEL